MTTPHIPNPPPGQNRPYSPPTTTGKISFTYPQTGLKSETYYLTWGDFSSGNKTPLIVLHGGPAAAHEYLLPTVHLAADQGIPVLLYDQIGCGQSTHFPDRKGDAEFWCTEMFIAELENVISSLGITEFDLLGHSWGGMLAAQYAITKQPKGLRKLVIACAPADMQVWASTTARLRSGLPEDVQATLQKCEDEGRTDSEEYEAATMYFYGLHLCRLQPWPKEFEILMGHLGEGTGVYETMIGASEFNISGSLKNWSVEAELGAITRETCPGGLLVMNGEFDEAQDEVMRAFTERVNCETKWAKFRSSSHTPMLEEAEKWVEELGKFLG